MCPCGTCAVVAVPLLSVLAGERVERVTREKWLIQASKQIHLNLLYPLEVINGDLGKAKSRVNLWAILI